MDEAVATFTRIFMRYDALQKRPIEVESGTSLPAAQIHTIEAIGKGHGQTVTTLATHFAISKSAVSQIVAKLVQQGYLLRTKAKGNDKEVLLRLTPKGRKAFQKHERTLAASLSGVLALEKHYSVPEIQSFVSILGDVDRWFEYISHPER